MKKNDQFNAIVVLHFLIGNSSGNHAFFKKLEEGKISISLTDWVFFEVFYTLTQYYKVSVSEVIPALLDFISFKGIVMRDKEGLSSCLDRVLDEKMDLLDVYIVAGARFD